MVDAFKEAADRLKKIRQEGGKTLNDHIPINFLLRQAIELHLKSVIIILHRRLRIPYGNRSPDSEPMVQDKGRWVPMRKVHSVALLFSDLKSLLQQKNSFLRDHTRTDWTLPSNVDSWIATIEQYDPSSTFLRYPMTQDKKRDQEKSSFKEVSAAGTGFDSLLMFSLDDSPAKPLGDALSSLADLLEGLHFGLRVEICDGA